MSLRAKTQTHALVGALLAAPQRDRQFFGKQKIGTNARFSKRSGRTLTAKVGTPAGERA